MKYFLILLLLVTSSLYAQEFSIEYSIDRESISLGEVLKYKILIAGDLKATPTLNIPKLQDFNIISNRKTSKFNTSTGDAVSSVEFIFMLAPLKEGSLEISGFKVEAGGIKYDVETVEIKVGKSKNNNLSEKYSDSLESKNSKN
ncbi:MAG: BatD family protein [Candidatus Kaelpia aquatica]|nr:BatD family protein [Candidatus Kaelpia aquatica]